MSSSNSCKDEASGSSHQQICCLLDNGDRCNEPAGNASYNKRIQKSVAKKKLKFSIDPCASHTYICDYHKNVIQNKRTRKSSEDNNGTCDKDKTGVLEVDLCKLSMSALRRYKNYYDVPVKSDVNKVQMAETLTDHLKSIPVNEKETIAYFIYSVKNNTNRLDRKKVPESSDN